ncbi:BNR-4 repeat-containing protein [uncultured Kordia sp.]|uniref:BNR-4 repeat-containing protein n=1 Tax=uncultured Kordia sp. TaxID=507699 RepID=UPI002604A28B|nr:BNR-4 repeat-containing protein [uncultured Kordia sp.]
MKYIQYAMLFFCSVLFAQKQATHTYSESEAISSEAYQSMTFNGVWSWFSDPRAVYYEGKFKRTYAGWIDNYGDVHIGYYDHDTKKVASKVIYDNLEIDDHDNPTILLDDDGRLLVFFNTHLQEASPLYMRTSTHTEDITEWSPVKELFLNDTEKFRNASAMHHTYTNPVRLSAEDGKIYLFWRGTFLKPSYAVSSDSGKTWSKGKILFMPTQKENAKAPYTKVYSDGVSKIHFAFTDGHPTKETNNGLYYMYYENGAFYKANGTKIKEVSQLPVYQSELDVIFESDSVKSWNWDIAQDAEGNPIVTYAKFPDAQTHIYSYATFQNGQWKSHDVVNAGGWFPKTREGTKELEPHYAGGIVLDHETPNTVYLSVKQDEVFEIEQWTTNDNGKSWNAKKITSNSTKNNVRPFAVRGAKKGNPLQVLWLQNTKYIYYAHDTRGKETTLSFKDRYHTAVKMNLEKPTLNSELTEESVQELLRQIAEYLLENPNHEIAQNDWRFGIMFAGIDAFYKMTKEVRYKNELVNIQQYQQEESEDSDEDELDVFGTIWSYNARNDRVALQKIENLIPKDFSLKTLYFPTASLIYAIRNFNESITAIEALKKEFTRIVDALLINEIESASFIDEIPENKAFVIYCFAAGMNDGLVDKKYTDIVLKTWKQLQEKLLENDQFKKLDVETNAAILLAGKEIYTILKRNN